MNKIKAIFYGMWKPLIVILLSIMVIQGFFEPTPVINNIEYKDYDYKIAPTFNVTVNKTLKNDTYINNTYIDDRQFITESRTIVPPVVTPIIVQSFNNTTLVTNLNETVNNNVFNNETINNEYINNTYINESRDDCECPNGNHWGWC
jgi:hypothetical protein